MAMDYELKVKKYEQEKETISKVASSFEQLRNESKIHSDKFGIGVIFLQISILLSSIATLSKFQCLATAQRNKTKEATLNGLHLVLDANSGSILKMSYAGAGTIMDSKSDLAGMIDLAYPVKEFEVLRLASRFSQRADVAVYPDSVLIFWDKLGLSRTNFNIDGKVSATVKLVASPDGKSILMTAKVINLSGTNVLQVIFPDLSGPLPVAGAQSTYFRTGNFANLPFVDLAKDDTKESTPYV
jgi:hypothetical protein